MDSIPNAAPEDARPAPAELRLRTNPIAAALVAFPFAVLPPVVLAAALAGTIPAAASWAIAVLGTAALWLALAVGPSMTFTADALVVARLFGRRRRIPWTAVRSVEFDDVTNDETDEVLHRVIVVRYRRYPDQPLPAMPTRLIDFREWNRAHFRTCRLPLLFPPRRAGDDARGEKRASPLARRSQRMRAIVLRELAARGYDLAR